MDHKDTSNNSAGIPPAGAPSATGPRTPAGKKRSSRNALRHGLFSKDLLLPGESPAARKSLRAGLFDQWRPEGTQETEEVEYLGELMWQRRRMLLAQAAETAWVPCLSWLDLVQTQRREAWDGSRAGETAGGMLRPTSNPLLIRAAIFWLKKVRHDIETTGFLREDLDSWLLTKLYGSDHDGKVPLGFQFGYRSAVQQSTGNQNPRSADELTKIFEYLDAEIRHYESDATRQLDIFNETRNYLAVAGMIPPPDSIDRFMRYETHVNREIDRTIDRIEHLQGKRLG